MAPINDQLSYSVHSSTSTKTPFSCMCRREGALSDGWEWFLPITRKGHFFQDSFFENSRSHFDAAIRDVLGKWGDTSMLTDNWHDTANNLSRYRQLRSNNMKEENQAVTVSSDCSSQKIVLDVHEFVEGEIKVKVIGEKELLVEGVVEGKKEAGGSSSSQRFSRRFPLSEDTDMEAISSVMSSDGILTINIPKVSTKTQEGIKNVAINKASSSNVTQQSNMSTTSSTQEESGSAKARSQNATDTNASERYCECCYKKLQSGKKTSEGSEQLEGMKIPIKINTSLTKNGTSETQKMQNSVESQVLSEDKKRSSNSQNSCSNLQKEESCISNQSQMKTSSANNERNSSPSTYVKSNTAVPISVNDHPLPPIMRRGLFFNDSIFENARNDFQSAVQEVLSKWGERSSLMDDLSCYRSLRTRDLREENQAVKVNEDENNHKFVLDVHDFMNGGEVNVKAINDRELVVEGQIEKQEGGSKSVKRFIKRFVVPSNIILESVTSVMSSDGVLTITAPKKPATIQIQDVTSPVRSEKTQESLSQCQQESMKEKQNETQSSSATSKSIHESCKSTSSNVQSNVHQTSTSQQANMSRQHIIPVSVEERDVSSSVRSEKTQEASSQCQKESVNEKQNATQSSVASKNIRESSESTTSQVHQRSSSQQSNVAREHIIPVHLEERQNEMKVDHNIHMTKTSSDSEKSQDKRMENSESSVVNSAKSETSNTNSQMSNVNQRSLNSDNLSHSSMGQLLPITRKGSFFNDSFFESSRQSFQTAIRDVLQKFNNGNSQTDDITAYLGLRERSISNDNLALNVHEDEHCHKVVLDARDFTNGDINVSIVGERELLIEGRTENKKDSSASSQRFSQRFLLPDSVDIHSITSAISSDGVLTVESPKSGASSLSNVQKMSSEAHSKNESHNDSGHKWEEKAVKESSEQSEGYSSRSYSKSYRAHQEQTSTNVF